MGGIESHNQQSSKDLLAEFTETRRQNNGVVLTDKKSENTYFLKEFNFANETQYENQFKRLKGVQSQPQNQNVLPLVRLFSQTFNSICSNSYKIYALYEYPSITLQQEISARKKQDKYFDQCELWSILQSCANALSQLKPTISLHPKNVFIVPDGVLKVINNQMVDEDYRCYLKDGVYYAPEKIREFKKNDNQNSLRKESIFSLGMTMLHAALLSPVSSCYNYQSFQFDDGKLEKYIQQLVNSQPLEQYNQGQIPQKGRYSQEFIQMLAMILEPNPNKRASLMQVHGMLNKVWNTEAQEQNEKNLQEQYQDGEPRLTQRKNQTVTQTLRGSKKLEQRSINSQFVLKDQTQKTKPANNYETKQQTQSKGIQSENRSYLASFHPSQRPSKPNLSESNNFVNKNFTKPIDSMVGSTQIPYSNTYIPSSSTNALYRPFNVGAGTTGTTLPFNKQNNIYTDPKLLQMIRKDLQDINQLKKSSMLNTYGTGYSNPYLGSSNFCYSDIGNNMFSAKSSFGLTSSNIQQIYTVNTQVNLPQKSESYPTQNLKTQVPKTQPVLNQIPLGFIKTANNAVYVVEQYQDGRKFEGNLVNGLKEGHGKLIYQDGAYYQGDFKNDKMQGNGTLYYGPNRAAYQGSWFADQFHGYGTLYNQNPLQLNGSFNYNDFNLIEDFWVRYQGNFDCDNKSGFGKLILSNGQEFHGNFEHDIINGKGVFLTKDEQQITGIWEDNILVQLDA